MANKRQSVSGQRSIPKIDATLVSQSWIKCWIWDPLWHHQERTAAFCTNFEFCIVFAYIMTHYNIRIDFIIPTAIEFTCYSRSQKCKVQKKKKKKNSDCGGCLNDINITKMYIFLISPSSNVNTSFQLLHKIKLIVQIACHEEPNTGSVKPQTLHNFVLFWLAPIHSQSLSWQVIGADYENLTPKLWGDSLKNKKNKIKTCFRKLYWEMF